jgi:cytochrome c oxidase assembly protein subunit 11
MSVIQTHDPVLQDRKIRRTALICLGIFAGMLGLAYASVPLYDLFCRMTGFGGTPIVASQPASGVGVRPMSVRFDANVAPGLPWRFTAETVSVDLKPGETRTVYYRVTNTSSRPTTGMATFNVQPELAGAYFNKLQCFCFADMPLAPGESKDVPVVFFIDPAIEQDENLRKLTTITLSYTFFVSRNGAPVMGEAALSKAN